MNSLVSAVIKGKAGIIMPKDDVAVCWREGYENMALQCVFKVSSIHSWRNGASR